ncbi:MAG: DUF1559 domain-containing protein [bacterium]|jgi:prepilin-type processing-associated H-X9-DG protein|nr:DUF1559 domain-containing protein [Candidatus Cloacimonadota bacterium]MDD2485726.1 DUF1559 domain-containing protein [bacterium]MDD3805010.1 DUF1559 domain-containing protein [bacterium]MDD4152394.1 DUF1559 domain-containing protein [bacterium]MDD4557678.1 DUF1559 domain-containing protein [bacterium]
MRCMKKRCIILYTSGRCGFALAELLVIISITALLSAMFLPAFVRNREKVEQSTCINNLKQIGIALKMYAQDYDEFFPTPIYNASGTAGSNRSWEDLLAGYCDAKGKYNTNTNPKYANTVYDCPSLDPSSVERTIGDYGLCQLFAPLPASDPRRNFIDTRNIKNPAAAGAVTEARGSFAYTAAKIGAVDEQWVSSPYRFLRNAHSEGINILYCDGHVGWKRAVIGDDLQAVFRYDAKCLYCG